MTSDVVLSAALRSNLLSLQNTQSSIDVAQFRLSTGKKVNSALDNPQSYFASQALTNRASDLTRLLDGIGQSIQVIKAADNGVTALTKLVQQAESIAKSAQDALAQGQAEAKVIGDRDLRGVNDLDSLPGIANNDTIIFTVTDENGAAIDIGGYSTTANSATATATITIATNDSIEDLIAKINNIHFEDNNNNIANGAQALEASLDSSGHLQIRTLNGGNFNANFTTVLGTDGANLALASALGFGDIAKVVADADANATNNNVEFTAIADTALRSTALYDGSGTTKVIASRSSLLSNLQNETSATALFQNVNATTDDYLIGINGGAQTSIELFSNNGTATVTVQDFIDDINNSTALNTKIRAEFDDDTGVLSLVAIDSSVQSIEIGVTNSVETANFGFGVNTNLTGNATDGEIESIRLASAAGNLAQFESDFNNIREQIDALVSNGDTGYRGTNLLNGDNLLTVFNEDRSSSLTTEGSTFTADGLGIEQANFSREATVQGALDQVSDALSAVRSFGSSLSNDLAVIQTRQEFTNSLINTLKAGADALTVADQNEEGAKLLALQTRQQLGVTALSLASQSQQSILRLF